jgi:hypothetical protein
MPDATCSVVRAMGGVASGKRCSISERRLARAAADVGMVGPENVSRRKPESKKEASPERSGPIGPPADFVRGQ